MLRDRAPQSVKFFAIIYVNRSGSTLFSRLLSEATSDIYVFPEVEFPLMLLLLQERGTLLTDQSVYDLIKTDARSDALGLLDDVLRKICKKNIPLSLPSLLTDLAEASTGSRPKAVFFKLERLLYFKCQLEKTFEDISFVHVFRDPRAVVSSMLVSPIPEKPGFNMARGNVLYAAMHWRKYIRLVDFLPQNNVVSVCYENLMDDPVARIEILLNEVGLSIQLNNPKKLVARPYLISKLDTGIHSNVFGPFRAERTQAWSKELSTTDIQLVENVCEDEMTSLGYSLSHNKDRLPRVAMLVAVIKYWAAMITHIHRTTLLYMRRKGGFVAFARRINLELSLVCASHRMQRNARADSSQSRSYPAAAK